MKKNIFIITLLVGCCSLSAWAQKQEKTITVEVNNNWNRAKTDEPVVINLRDLHTGFKVKSAVVMEGSTEIPSQLDDLNRDRKMDELAFVTSLPAQEKHFRYPCLLKRVRKPIRHGFMRKCSLLTREKESISQYRQSLSLVQVIYIVWSVLMVLYWNRNW